MSNRIAEIVEVLEGVLESYSQNPSENIRRIRIAAVHSVADLRTIDERSVLDKCTRQLQPDVKDASDFDRLVKEWLMTGSNVLQQALLNHAADSDDEFFIKSFFGAVAVSDIDIATEFGLTTSDKTFIEGKARFKLHLVKERDPNLVRSAKKKWSKEHYGNVICAICDFSFLNSYGSIAEGYIEAHHKIPIHTLTSETKVTVDALAPVCANCHRILHRRRPWLSIEELHQVVLDQRKK
ncbi:MAG: HNH endonuclease [Thermodesulfovibrionales bacterium]|jgi:hypothetical protein